jgi:hypothetical protein
MGRGDDRGGSPRDVGTEGEKMRPQQIEAWALDVIDRVKHNQPVEETRVELKSKWPDDFPKTARQLAGHANAARGDDLLWLIGVDEATGVTGADRNELANWYPKIEAQFNDLAPAMQVVNVPFDGLTVVALCFDTERRPFLVKNPVHGQQGGGPVEFEVPWREGNRTRTARRSELILLGYPLPELPEIEVIGGELVVSWTNEHNPPPEASMTYDLQLQFYAAQLGSRIVSIPFHRCRVRAYLTQYPDGKEFDKLDFWVGSPTYGRDDTITRTLADIQVHGSGLFYLNATGKSRSVEYNIGKIRVTADLAVAGSDRPVTVNYFLPRKRCVDGQLARWAHNTPLKVPDEAGGMKEVDDSW